MTSGTNAAPGMDRPCTRRRWPYALGVAVVLLSVAYASLPFWLPTGWLARRIERQLAAQLERPVSIGRLDIDWAKGVVIENLAIGDLPDAPNPHLARIARLRCDFTPVLTLVTGRIDQLEIDGLQMWVVQNAEGRLNIERLPEGRLPTFSYRLDNATCHLWTPQARQFYRIDTVHCRIEPERALLDLNGCATVPTGQRFGFDVRLTVPRLCKDRDLDLSGAVRVEWADLALTDLPLWLVPALPIEAVGGTTSGLLSFETRPDLSIDFNQWIVLRGVRLMWAGLDRPAVVPDAVLRCEGRWEPQNDRLTIGELKYESPAVYLAGAGRPAIQIDPRGDLSLDLSLAGRIKSWELLRREAPQIDRLAESLGVDLAGQESFTLKASRYGDEASLALTLEGGRSRWALARGGQPLFDAGEEVGKRLEVVASGNCVSRRVRPSVRLTLGDLLVSLTGEGCLPGGRASCPPQGVKEGGQDGSPPAGASAMEEGGQDAHPPQALAEGGQDARPPMGDSLPAQWWKSLAVNLELSTARVGQVVAMFPAAKRRPEFASWRGPVEATVQVVPASGSSRVELEFLADADAVLGWRPWFDKPSGQPLSIMAGATIPHEAAGRIDDLAFIVQYAPGSVQLETGRAHAEYRLQDDGHFEASMVLPVRAEHLEELARLCPRWIESAGRAGREIAGAVSMAIRAEAFRRPGEALARVKADIDAGHLAAQWPGTLTKPAGEPLTVRLVGHSHLLGETLENRLGAALQHPAGEFEALLAQAQGDASSPGSDFEHCALDARVHDWATLQRSVPALGRWLGECRAAGSAQAHINAVATNGQCSLDVALDAAETDLAWPGETPGSKPVGVPAELHWRWESEPDDPTAGSTWNLISGRARLAGLTVTEMTGQVIGSAAGENAPGIAGRSSRLAEAFASLRQVSAAHLRLKGSAACGPESEALYPPLAQLRERLGLSGTLQWKTEVSGNDEALRFAARLDAGALAWSTSTGQPAVPIVRKPADVPASVAVELAAVPGPDGSARRIDARVDANVHGNRLRAEAQALMFGWRGGAPQVGDLDGLVRLSLDNPQALPQLAPESAIEKMDGAGTIELGLERRGETTRLTGVHAEFQNLVVASGGSALALDGRGTWEPGGTRIPGLEWKWGESGGKIDGQVNALPGGVQGRVGLATSRLDVLDLQRQFAVWAGRLAPLTATIPRDQPEDSERLLRLALAFLARSDLKVDGQVGELEVVLPPGIPVHGEMVIHSLQAERGPVSFTFAGTVEGGAVRGRVETIADAAEPRMRLTYTAERIQPGPLVDAYLRKTFPGMTATGPLTLIDESNQKLLPAPGELNWPTGTGELIIHGGRLVGRAAPKAITRIFPGLNLASFDFSYMHSWFRKEVTGRIYHQMIYKGKYYNMYMNGYSELTGFRYEVGIDFLADFDSKYWAETGQGRVPLFTKTGRIRPDGSIENEEVIYMPQRFFDTILVKNNPVFTAYHAVRKRVREAK